jgi:transcriptional regulator with XRE-family HTH domain
MPTGRSTAKRTSAAGPSPAPNDNADALRRLGRLVRHRRRELGFTLSELADRSGLSTPFLSQVENGVGTPSLTSLFAIARVLDTTAEALLAGPPIEPVVVIRASEGARYPVSDQGAGAERRQITGTGEPISAAEYVVAPGTDLGGFEASTGRDLLHVTAGRLTVEVRRDGVETSHDLLPGDTILYDTGDAHRWRVSGGSATRFLHIVATVR